MYDGNDCCEILSDESDIKDLIGGKIIFSPRNRIVSFLNI